MRTVSATNNTFQSAASYAVQTVLKTIFSSVSCPFGYSGLNCAESEYSSHWSEKQSHKRVTFQHIKVFLFNLCTLMAVALSSPFMDFTVIRLEAGVGNRGFCAGGSAAHHSHCSDRGGRQVSRSSAYLCMRTVFESIHSTLVEDTAGYICTSDHFSSKKRSKAGTAADFGKSYINHPSANSPLVNGSNGVPAVAGMPRIPRATANKGWNTGSALEMTPSNSQQNLIPSGRNSVSVPPRTE